jgi:hypothetical protein
VICDRSHHTLCVMRTDGDDRQKEQSMYVNTNYAKAEAYAVVRKSTGIRVSIKMNKPFIKNKRDLKVVPVRRG